MPSNPPLFRLPPLPPPSDPDPFSPPSTNRPSNGLFSAATTPVAAHRSSHTPGTLFAGSTPGFRSGGRRSLFSPQFSGGVDPGLFSDPYDESMETTGYYDGSSDADADADADGGEGVGESEYDLLGASTATAATAAVASALGTEIVLKHGAVTEPAALIIRTEELLSALAGKMAATAAAAAAGTDSDTDSDEPALSSAAAVASPHLPQTAKHFLDALTSHLPPSSSSTSTNTANTPLHKAHHIASLLLPLHFSASSVPDTLRRWLTTHAQHPTRAQLQTLKSFHPNAVFSPHYWDTLTSLLLRGEVAEALEILQGSSWDTICTDAPRLSAPGAGAVEKRYTRVETDAVKRAMGACVALLQKCPGGGGSSYSHPAPGVAVLVDGQRATADDWRIWQGAVYAACDALTGEDASDEEFTYYGLGGGGGGGGRAAGRAQVPVDVVRGLKGIYEICRGDRDAVMASAARWEDAVCALMFWGADDAFPEEEEGGREGELVRLRRVAESVVEGDMPLNPTSDAELAVGAVLVWDTSVLFDVLPAHSLLVAAAVVELCGWGGSIERKDAQEDGERRRRRGGGMGFDEEELAVLGMEQQGGGEEAERADAVLREYACGLCALEWIDEKAEFEGWEAGVGVLDRIQGGRDVAGKLLTQLELTSKPRVEKLLTYCTENNLPSVAADIASTFATHITTTSPGTALHFFSLSPDHRPQIHTLTTHLLTLSLLSSTSYPPTPDATLTHLLTSPTSTPSPILRFELSGYATLRNFYAHRDSSSSTPTPSTSAAAALVAAIKSAGERLDGGVLDADWECAVEPWMLGALLGELRPLLDADVVSVRMCCDVMKVLTDFELVGGECWRRADAFLGRVVAARGRGDVDGLDGGGGGVGMVGGGWEEVDRGIEEGVLRPVEVGRGWDWRERQGAGRGGVAELVRGVRLALSRVVARAWLRGEE